MDRVTHPEESRKFVSPNGRYELVVQTFDHWKTRESVAILWKAGKQVWRQTLPHSHGPRRVTVTDMGVSILLDEWVNIRSDHAVMIVSKEGRPVRSWSFDDVQMLLELPVEEINAKAEWGWWLGGEEVLDVDCLSVPTGGSHLIVDVKRLVLCRKDAQILNSTTE
jgi:hypothetical protein